MSQFDDVFVIVICRPQHVDIMISDDQIAVEKKMNKCHPLSHHRTSVNEIATRAKTSKSWLIETG